MENSLRIFQQLFYCYKKASWQFIFILLIPVVLISCTKEYSCENNCRLMPLVVNDTTNKDSLPAVKYNYYLLSYHVSLAGTGNNTWGYTIPAFDSALGMLDTIEINMFTSLSYYLTLYNNASFLNSYNINISRRDSLSCDSMVLINHDYAYNYGLQNVSGLSSYEDSLSVMDNVQLTSFITDRLDKFTGNKYLAIDYNPLSNSSIVGNHYSADGSFHDSTYIRSTYHYKKKIP